MSTPANKIGQQLQQLIKASQDKILESTVKEIRTNSHRLFDEVRLKYQDFFFDLEDELFGKPGAAGTPPAIAKMLNKSSSPQWNPTGSYWQGQKDIFGVDQDHYTGLTDAKDGFFGRDAKGNIVAKTRSALKPRKGQPIINFRGYINTLQNNPKSVEKLFGPLKLSHVFEADGYKFSPDLNQKGTLLRMNTTKNGKAAKLPSKVLVKTEIEAFSKLNGIYFTEKAIVKYLAEATGAKNQWRKIISRTGWHNSVRPLRAMIAPMITWQLQVALKNIFKKQKW